MNNSGIFSYRSKRIIGKYENQIGMYNRIEFRTNLCWNQ